MIFCIFIVRSKLKILPLEIEIDMSASSHIIIPFILISAIPSIIILSSSVNLIESSLLYGLKFVIWWICGALPSMGDAKKSTSKFVKVPFLTLRFHSPVRSPLNALVILNSVSGTVITKEFIVPIAEKLSSKAGLSVPSFFEQVHLKGRCLHCDCLSLLTEIVLLKD